ncbi:unnamed protein product [Anisakis simplex]|uniref:MFS domain-containing protein n=1 Tax=Anisakis simplex TaxID=6269 RepID=A0A0M3KDM5_ANISI|nr:unnamed protein product [Anisakis simplex]
MRGYVAKISTPNDRARAVSMFGLAVMLAVTVGPMFQMFFTTLSFPGIDMFAGKFWLNIYTGPIYVALVANIASLILIIFFFKEKHFDRHPPGDKKVSLQRKESQAKAALTTDMRSFNIPLALTCIFIRMAGTLTIVTINTTTSPMMMSVFGWSNTRTVRIGSVAQACVGILIAANITGCNPTIYEWCADSLQVKPFVYLASMVVVLGIAITLATIAVDTLYSRILGNIDQGTMQGFFLFCMDIINVLGPLAIAPLFTSSGQKYIWPINGSVAVAATIACLFAYAKFPR